eukprot:TRINITY_DN1958_c0_g1_i1.p1 TRINITY_DN1958_c0_g1~~TRINITY_DN1958_c0_g1_i1.p1  ORF type:complete len:846 (+),score=278.70 TRINITY_DN1958_c0_g1_i1:206-2539(+)
MPQDARRVHQKMSEVHMLTQDEWLMWIMQEVEALEGAAILGEAGRRVFQLHEAALLDWPASVSIWLSYFQTVLRSLECESEEKKEEEKEEEKEKEEEEEEEEEGRWDIDEVRTLFSKCLQSGAALHPTRGNLLWDLYRSIEIGYLGLLEEGGAEHCEQQKRVFGIYLDQLSCPFGEANEVVMEEARVLLCENGALSGDWMAGEQGEGGYLSVLEQIFSCGKRLSKERKLWESRLERMMSGGSGDPMEVWKDGFLPYIEWEIGRKREVHKRMMDKKSRGKDVGPFDGLELRVSRPSTRLISLLHRASEACSLIPDMWIRCVDVIRHDLKTVNPDSKKDGGRNKHKKMKKENQVSEEDPHEHHIRNTKWDVLDVPDTLEMALSWGKRATQCICRSGRLWSSRMILAELDVESRVRSVVLDREEAGEKADETGELLLLEDCRELVGSWFHMVMEWIAQGEHIDGVVQLCKTYCDVVRRIGIQSCEVVMRMRDGDAGSEECRAWVEECADRAKSIRMECVKLIEGMEELDRKHAFRRYCTTVCESKEEFFEHWDVVLRKHSSDVWIWLEAFHAYTRMDGIRSGARVLKRALHAINDPHDLQYIASECERVAHIICATAQEYDEWVHGIRNRQALVNRKAAKDAHMKKRGDGGDGYTGQSFRGERRGRYQRKGRDHFRPRDRSDPHGREEEAREFDAERGSIKRRKIDVDGVEADKNGKEETGGDGNEHVHDGEGEEKEAEGGETHGRVRAQSREGRFEMRRGRRLQKDRTPKSNSDFKKFL